MTNTDIQYLTCSACGMSAGEKDSDLIWHEQELCPNRKGA